MVTLRWVLVFKSNVQFCLDSIHLRISGLGQGVGGLMAEGPGESGPGGDILNSGWMG